MGLSHSWSKNFTPLDLNRGVSKAKDHQVKVEPPTHYKIPYSSLI